MRERLQRRSQIALCIDQKGRRSDNFLALADTFQDLDIPIAAPSKPYWTRFEAAFTLDDQHDLAGTTVDNGAHRNCDHGTLAGTRLENDIRIHVDLESPVRIRHLDPHTGRPITHNTVTVSVRHADCAHADAWAAALNVLGVEAGLPLAERLDLAAQFVVEQSDGEFDVQQSTAWKAREALVGAVSAEKP